jgi:uncharacterized protein (TIGR02466 family)
MQAQIDYLFPTPLFRVLLDRELLESEIKIIKYNSTLSHKNKTNKTSNNKFILEEPGFKELKKFILSGINSYVHHIMKPKNHIELYITESWLNYTNYGESHHRHYHPNSILSGVFYIEILKNDGIHFFKPTINHFFIEATENTFINSYGWNLGINKNELILFPSSLEHSVHTNLQKPKKTRISLSFNTFIKGNINNLITTSLNL